MTTIASAVAADLPSYLAAAGRATTFKITKAVQAGSKISLEIPATVGGKAIRQFQIQLALWEYTASATVGTRQMTVEILDETGAKVYSTNLTTTVSDTTNDVTRLFNLATSAVASQDSGGVLERIGQIMLRPGMMITVEDRDNIDSAGDTQGLTLHGLAY